MGTADRYFACENNKQRFAGLPFPEDHLARGILFFEELYQKFAQLPSAQTRKKRDILENLEAQ
jgi:hypothetical protein